MKSLITSTNNSQLSIEKSCSLKRTLSKLEKTFSIIESPELADFVNWSSNTKIPIHRWYRYREAYAPGLITKLNLKETILDPYCGCGSVIVGAAQLGLKSVGVDINPIATFVSRVKLTPLSEKQINEVVVFYDKFQEEVDNYDPSPIPKLNISLKVFEPEILDYLLKLKNYIISFSNNDEALQNFLFLAWLSILEDVGSYFKEGNGIKYRNKKRLKNGYIKREEGAWQLKRFGADQRAFVISKFKEQLSVMISDVNYWKAGAWGLQKVIQGSALALNDLVGETQFDSIIFSPPYANRFDYFESMKVELWFGGFVNSYEELNSLRKKSIRSHLGADLARPAIEFEPLEEIISLMDRNSSSWRMRVPTALRGYFSDMYQTLLHCRNLTPSGTCYIVIGNSAFAGTIVPSDTLIAQLGLKAGFNSAKLLVARHLTVAPQQRLQLTGLESFMRESIVVLN
jgi:site-specific DNA-methyltransferase (adenine-specific)